MKVSVQEKIAELEARIADLEKNASFHEGFAPRFYGDTEAVSHLEADVEAFRRVLRETGSIV